MKGMCMSPKVRLYFCLNYICNCIQHFSFSFSEKCRCSYTVMIKTTKKMNTFTLLKYFSKPTHLGQAELQAGTRTAI